MKKVTGLEIHSRWQKILVIFIWPRDSSARKRHKTVSGTGASGHRKPSSPDTHHSGWYAPLRPARGPGELPVGDLAVNGYRWVAKPAQ